MNLKKLVGIAVILLFIFFVISQPDQAAQVVQNVLVTAKGVAESIITFFTSF